MSFLAALAKEKSVPQWFMDEVKAKAGDERLLELLAAEIKASDGYKEKPHIWTDEMVAAFAAMLLGLYSKSLKNK